MNLYHHELKKWNLENDKRELLTDVERMINHPIRQKPQPPIMINQIKQTGSEQENEIQMLHLDLL